MTEHDKVLNLLGLACRAGKVICGDYPAANYLKKKTVPMLFLASDGGRDNTEKYTRLAERKGMRIVNVYTKSELGHAVGKPQSVVILVADGGFARAIDKVMSITGNH
ncbi:MAG: ribosomal L7Ae/L30e/S12e/Gadd45 family protein [Megasphaera sp.]|jgi:ribosomal protein L7Ae-like RNA K-turn-binding protein|nr:ribosomal L7Ae/L30e/S12e/Gadd45 family protein [Megasphaera sp.]MCI1247792.1 ribosomal L7Ae/L30e/S12e/Gadd45 family protein [Megasphaera sp.]